MKSKTEKLLLALGIMPNLSGFRYLVDAIQIYAEAKGRMSITKELYPQTAARHNTTGIRVERAIRHAIESIGKFVPMSDVMEILGTCPDGLSGKWKNAEFIALCALRIGGTE